MRRKLLLFVALMSSVMAFAQNGQYDKLTGIEWERDSLYLWSKDSTYVFPVSADAFRLKMSVTDTWGSLTFENKSDKPIEIDWSYISYEVNDKWDATCVDYRDKYEKVYKNASTYHPFNRARGARTTRLLDISGLEKIRKKTKEPVAVKVDLGIKLIYNDEAFWLYLTKFGRYVGKKK